MSKELPTSIKVIGWFYQVIGVILIFLGVLALFGVTLVANLFGRGQVGIIGGLVLLLILALVGFLIIFLGRGVLRKNQLAWWIALVLSIINILSLLLGARGQSVIPLAINAFIIWKLLEHKEIFLGKVVVAKEKKVSKKKVKKK